MNVVVQGADLLSPAVFATGRRRARRDLSVLFAQAVASLQWIALAVAVSAFAGAGVTLLLRLA